MRQRGVLLVLVLILITTLFVLAAGFLSKKTQERKAVNLTRDSFQAQQLAFAGLETVRVRLQNDFNFPPATMGPLQEVFKFTEVVRDYDDATDLGQYQIFCDRRWVDTPYWLLRVTSVGQVGDADGNPVRHKIIAEYSMAPGNKGDLINLLDLGSF
jgi:hypothetical protein